MPKNNNGVTKTERVLSIYHMFRFYEEVSMQEMRNRFRGYSDKTFSRDIALLKQAGVPIRFSVRRKAFVQVDEHGNEARNPPRRPPVFPEGKKDKQYIEKLIRLITIMDDVDYEDCDVWYKATFPHTSNRTMQRDFALMKEIGYNIYYKRAWETPWEKENEDPVGHYYFEGVYNA